MMKKVLLIVLWVSVMLLSACSPVVEPEELDEAVYPVVIEPEVPTAGYSVVTHETFLPIAGYPVDAETPELNLEAIAEIVVEALASKDMATVALFAHPEMGVRFSPYAYVEAKHMVFLPDELPGLVGSDEVYRWGIYDGIGEPIRLTFDEYYERFLYSADFANPELKAVNERIGLGNSLSNLDQFFPGSTFIEFHFSGFEQQYEGMDWVSLRLIFVQEGGDWYLVGLVNDQWTT